MVPPPGLKVTLEAIHLSAPTAAVLWAWVGVVAWSDIRYRRIPNWFILIGMVAGIATAVMLGTFLSGLAGAAVAFALGIMPFALRALGAGDVKATMVVGLFVGPMGIIQIILATALLSGLFAWLWWAALRFWPADTPPSLPVGLPLALATIALTLH
jgi:Flp pilus assembly protein protease CpaA